jgi:hypothetical protein
MSYTEQTLANDTFERLKSSGAPVQPSIIPRLVTLVPSALRLLPRTVRERFGEAEAELYRKNYTVTMTAGQGSLATHTNLTSEPMIPSEISKVTNPDVVTASNPAGKLQRVGSENALNLSRSLEFSYYAVEDNILYTALGNDRTAITSDSTVRAACPPLIANVKFSHEPLLVELMIELIGIPAKAVA